jgi:hypothetical protein
VLIGSREEQLFLTEKLRQQLLQSLHRCESGHAFA